MKNRLLVCLIPFVFIGLIVFFSYTRLYSNLWGILIETSYFIPTESSVFLFEVTKMNEGSGDWWLYGEDNFYYYALNQDSEEPRYFKLKKGLERMNFNRFDYKSWSCCQD